MKNPQKEVERLLKNPVIGKQGAILVNQEFPTKTFIQVTLDPFPGDPHGRTLLMCPPEIWVLFVEVMKGYFTRGKRGKKKSKKKGDC